MKNFSTTSICCLATLWFVATTLLSVYGQDAGVAPPEIAPGAPAAGIAPGQKPAAVVAAAGDVQHHPDDVVPAEPHQDGAVQAPAAGEPVPLAEPPKAEEKAVPADGEEKKPETADAKKAETDGDKKKAEKKKSWWSWSALTCVILHPFGYNCDGKKDEKKKEGAAADEKGHPKDRFRGMIAVIEDDDEDDNKQQLESIEKEVDSAAVAEQEEQHQPEGENSAEPVKGEVHVSASAVESTVDEQGHEHTNVSQLNAQGTM